MSWAAQDVGGRGAEGEREDLPSTAKNWSDIITALQFLSLGFHTCTTLGLECLSIAASLNPTYHCMAEMPPPPGNHSGSWLLAELSPTAWTTLRRLPQGIVVT